MTNPLSFDDVAEASYLIGDLKRVERRLTEENCGLTQVGDYHDPLTIAAVAPAYRRALEGKRAEMRDRLAALGVNPDSAQPPA